MAYGATGRWAYFCLHIVWVRTTPPVIIGRWWSSDIHRAFGCRYPPCIYPAVNIVNSVVVIDSLLTRRCAPKWHGTNVYNRRSHLSNLRQPPTSDGTNHVLPTLNPSPNKLHISTTGSGISVFVYSRRNILEINILTCPMVSASVWLRALARSCCDAPSIRLPYSQ